MAGIFGVVMADGCGIVIGILVSMALVRLIGRVSLSFYWARAIVLIVVITAADILLIAKVTLSAMIIVV